MIKIYLRRHPHSLQTDVFIESHNDNLAKGDTIGHWYFDHEGMGTVKREVYEPGQAHDFKPTMTLDERDLRDVISAFALLAKEENISLPDESFAKGKLESMSEHLSDMRKLVFAPIINEKKN